MDALSEKLSIKNLLFTKAIPNFEAPVSSGHKAYGCIDCGDKFLFETSYNDHVNRKSVRISYMCRFCNKSKVFYNRCNLLRHIRCHAFKTATINVTDLKVEPLPLSHYNIDEASLNISTSNATSSTLTVTQTSTATICHECNMDITVTGLAFKDRASHWMSGTSEVYSCPVCLFALPSLCALKVHLRLHMKVHPYHCPECGIQLFNKNIQYPYNHDCEGFRMMRATARLNCSVPECCLFHPNDYKEHMTKYHLKKVHKCPYCVVACFNESTMEKHLKEHKANLKSLLFYQCDICPGRYVLQNPKLNDHHLKSHINSSIFPCWACGSAFKEVQGLLTHFIKKHSKTNAIETALNAIINDTSMATHSSIKRVYRVVKRCEQCKRSFTYKCKYDQIVALPSECPFKCTSAMESDVTPVTEDGVEDFTIQCHLCQRQISQHWNEIKKHYAELHKSHKCLDAKILITRMNIKKYLTKTHLRRKMGRPRLNKTRKTSEKGKHRLVNKPTSSIIMNELNTTPPKLPSENSFKANSSSEKSTQPSPPSEKSINPITSDEKSASPNTSSQEEEFLVCNMCGDKYKEKSALEDHMKSSHRDLCMAYQCMECGQNFVVKPTFSKHLLLEHNITDAEEYIRNRPCYNENALMKYQDAVQMTNEPLRENQCRICRDEFEGPEDLEKHFRTHGMAFLMKKTSNKNNAL